MRDGSGGASKDGQKISDVESMLLFNIVAGPPGLNISQENLNQEHENLQTTDNPAHSQSQLHLDSYA
jgi:hypothetical protein